MICIQDERPKKNSANAPIEQVNERAIEPRLCHGCVGEFPDLVALDNQYREKGVKIIGISLDKTSDIDSKIVPFIKKSGGRFDILVPDMDDPQPIIDAVTKHWTGAMPATFIFDQQGKLAYERFGVINRDQVIGVLESMLKS